MREIPSDLRQVFRWSDGKGCRTGRGGSLHLRLCGGAGKLLCLSDVYPVCGGNFCCGQSMGVVRHRLRRGAGRMPAAIVPLPCRIAARSRIGGVLCRNFRGGKPAVSGAECRGPAAPGGAAGKAGRKIREGGPRSDRRKGRTVLPKERRIYAPAARRGCLSGCMCPACRGCISFGHGASLLRTVCRGLPMPVLRRAGMPETESMPGAGQDACFFSGTHI